MKRILFTMMMALMFAASTYAQRFAVNTNLAYDAVLAPSLGMEMKIGRQTTLNLNIAYGPKILLKDNMNLLAINPEFRYYVKGVRMYGLYVGAEAVLSTYNLTFGEKRYEGDAGGAGLSFGYELPITQRLLVDFHGSLGAVFYKQKEYFKGDDYDYEYTTIEGYLRANASGWHLAPMRIGISLTYIIF